MLRRKIPSRTFQGRLADYKGYKEPLRADFDRRCGYCDIHDQVLLIPFHIDHFAPAKKFAELKEEYSNLVYSCPSCNRAKWDHWPMETAEPSHDGQRGFVDPCSTEYDEHLSRKEDGAIVPQTALGTYISYRLKLHLRKHRFLWLLDKVIEQCEKVEQALQEFDDDDPDVLELKEKHYQLLRHYQTYHKIVRGAA